MSIHLLGMISILIPLCQTLPGCHHFCFYWALHKHSVLLGSWRSWLAQRVVGKSSWCLLTSNSLWGRERSQLHDSLWSWAVLLSCSCLRETLVSVTRQCVTIVSCLRKEVWSWACALLLQAAGFSSYSLTLGTETLGSDGGTWVAPHHIHGSHLAEAPRKSCTWEILCVLYQWLHNCLLPKHPWWSFHPLVALLHIFTKIITSFPNILILFSL